MKNKISIAGYIGMSIFIITSILDKTTNINNKISTILMIVSLVLFIPMVIKALKSFKKDR